jgi:hypothetical protein
MRGRSRAPDRRASPGRCLPMGPAAWRGSASPAGLTLHRTRGHALVGNREDPA